MKNIRIEGVRIELVRGDIASQGDIDAVVNAANRDLKSGGGVAGALHRKAGPKLRDETKSMSPLQTGAAVLTGGYELPNQYVIHCLGPVYGRDKPEDKLLADCYRNALEIAEENLVPKVAFPSISTGAFGYPMEEAAKVALETVKEELPKLSSVELIRFVLMGEEAMEIHQAVMEEVFG